MKNIIQTANNGLKTKFDASKVKFKKTFANAKKLGVDLNDTMVFIKKDGFVWKVSFVTGNYSRTGRYFESVQLLPYIRLRNR